ncbi:MAG: hypothetical protein F6K32_27945, partial [Desertifilum sp. SIO1I2]|nr:hypothetical protein [Desertifilum sp. SIO1I2]
KPIISGWSNYFSTVVIPA